MTVFKGPPTNLEAARHNVQTTADTRTDEPKSGPGVVDCQQHTIGGATQLHDDFPVRAGRPGRIAQQVGYRTAKLDPVP
jgi:hypothetical protein